MHISTQQRGAAVSVRSLRNSILRASPVRRFDHSAGKCAVVLAFFLARLAGAQIDTQIETQIDTTSVATHRYLVLYRNASIPGDAESRIASVGARLTQRNEHLGIAAVQSTAQDDAATLRRLTAQPNVDYVLHDRIVSAHRLRLQGIAPASLGVDQS